MAVVSRAGEWFTVEVDGELLGQFRALLDANRFAMGMLHDDLVLSVELLSGLVID